MVSTTDTLKILLVEDNPADAKLLKLILEEEMPGHFEMVHETYLKEALQTFSEGNFDAVMLDLSLPDSSGVETLSRMSSVASDVPIVVLTGLDDEELARKALQFGAQDYLVKGQKERTALLRSLRYAIERHQSQKNLMDRLERLAFHDPLTGLLNRRGLQKELLEAVRSPLFNGSNLFALIIGLDNFKPILDNLGRMAGDAVLKEVSQRLKACLPSKARGGWLWGDEFMVLLPAAQTGEAVFYAESIRNAVGDSPVVWSSQSIRASLSVGVVLVPPNAGTIDELSSHAHFVLAQSKTGGKNRTSYSWESRMFSNESGQWKKDPAFGRFFVEPQPIYRLTDNHLAGYELLIRTHLPGFENPEDFFRLCLQANVMSLMDYQALKTCVEYSASMASGLRFHLNVFPSTLLDIPLEAMLECLTSNGGLFCVEISEKRINGDPGHLVEPIQALKKRGVKIGLDEVGFGYSPLESLLLLEPDVIKMSQKFFEGIEADPSKTRSMKRFLKMSESLGAEVIVEGIQKPSELDILRQMGIPYGEGKAWKRLE